MSGLRFGVLFVVGFAGIGALQACGDDGSTSVIPDTMIDDTPVADSNQADISIAFHAVGVAKAFACQLDGGTIADCASPFTATVAEGDHMFAVAAVGTKGQPDETPATYSWHTDLTPPDTAFTQTPTTGSSATTGVFGYAGTPATDVVGFECAFDGATFAACTSPSTIISAAGAHVFAVRAVDGAGNVDATPATFDWSIVTDESLPTATITEHPTDPSNVATPQFTFTTTDATTVQCEIAGVASLAACTSPYTTPTLADGRYAFVVVASNDAGSGSAELDWTVDRTGPVVTITSGPGAITASPTPTFMFTATGDPTTVTCQLDTGSATSCTGGTYTAATLADGSHTFAVLATDAAGNTGSASSTFTVDATAPGVTITSGPSGTVNTNPNTFAFTTTGAPTSITCAIDAGSATACSSPFTTGTLSQGAHTLVVTVTNAAGTSSMATATFTVDTIAPVVTFTSQPAANSNQGSATLTFTVTGAAITTTCSFDGSAAVDCSADSFATGTLSERTHALVVTATDAAGNAGSNTATWTTDLTAPGVTLDTIPSASALTVNYYDFKFHSGDGTATFKCGVDGATPTACTSPQTVSGLSYGGSGHTFTAQAIDAAGNVGSANATWSFTAGATLHYPFEQGSTANWSALSHDFTYDGSGTVPVIGGWAGTAAGSPGAIAYPGTGRTLTASADNSYVIAMWVRAQPTGATGTLVQTTLANGAAVKLAISGASLTLTAMAAGMPVAPVAAPLPVGHWTHLALRTSGTASTPGPVELWIDGAMVISMPSALGVGSGDLSTGALTGVDLDDVTVYDLAPAADQMCTTVARGTIDADLNCTPLAPVMELACEQLPLVDTGTYGMTVAQQPAGALIATTAGHGFQVTGAPQLDVGGLSAMFSTAPGHAITFWYDNDPTLSDTLIDIRTSCGGASFRTPARRVGATDGQQFQHAALIIGSDDGSGYGGTGSGGGSGYGGSDAGLPQDAGVAPEDAQLLDAGSGSGSGSGPTQPTCGVWVSTAGGNLNVFASSSDIDGQTSDTLPAGWHQVLIDEVRSGSTTTALIIEVDGGQTAHDTISIGQGDVFANISDSVLGPSQAGTKLDQLKLWGQTLTTANESFEEQCENAYDGRWRSYDQTCTMTPLPD
jgi:hypothetical protein